jgi:hypothetical protein
MASSVDSFTNALMQMRPDNAPSGQNKGALSNRGKAPGGRGPKKGSAPAKRARPRTGRLPGGTTTGTTSYV